MTQYPRIHSSPGVFSSAMVPNSVFTIWAWDRAAPGWGLPPSHFRMEGRGSGMGESFAFPPPIMRPPGSAQPHPGKGDNGQSGSITSQTPELGMQEQVRPRSGVLRKQWTGAATEKEAYGGQAGRRIINCAEEKGVFSYFPLSSR